MSLWGTQLDARAHQYSNLKQYAPRFLWPFVPNPGKDNETSCNLFARDFLDSCFIHGSRTINSLVIFVNGQN